MFTARSRNEKEEGKETGAASVAASGDQMVSELNQIN